MMRRPSLVRAAVSLIIQMVADVGARVCIPMKAMTGRPRTVWLRRTQRPALDGRPCLGEQPYPKYPHKCAGRSIDPGL